ncbi:hypothetical protein [Chelativorans sp.]|nr:hypothetical protein [Chelativorans sp.]
MSAAGLDAWCGMIQATNVSLLDIRQIAKMRDAQSKGIQALWPESAGG